MKHASVMIAPALVAVFGCVRTTGDFARYDFRTLPKDDEMVIVGTITVVAEGVERTTGTSIEADGISGSFQLPESGDVIWVVKKPRSHRPSLLTWFALPYSEDTLGLGENHVVLAKADPSGSEDCWYFGRVTLGVDRGKADELAAAVVGWARPAGEFGQTDDGQAHRADLARKYPNLSGLECAVATTGAAVTFP